MKINRYFDAFIIREIIRIIQSEKRNGKTNIGGVFSAVNTTTKGIRKWNCRLGVSKDVTGAGLRYDPQSRNLLTVWENNARAYRMIKVDTLEFLQVRGDVLIKDGIKTAVFLKYEDTAEVMKLLEK